VSSTDSPDPAAAVAAQKEAAADPDVRTYYGRPVVKQPEWTWEVPWYLFAGGMAGASTALSAGARLVGLPDLERKARLVAGAGAVVSPVLLVADLGRPQRFHHMLRVFKPTSAMSVGSWILAAYSSAASASAALEMLGWFPRLRSLADAGATVFAMPMATYTAVLMSDSSIPVWSEASQELPFLFGSSAAASAGAAGTLLASPGQAAPARRLAVMGAAGELAAGELMQRRLGDLGEVYEQGDAARWEKAAKACTAAGGALLAASGLAGAASQSGARSRWRRVADVAGSALVLAGSVCQRWAVYRAGFQSAWDPRHTVAPQRKRLDEGTAYRTDRRLGR
jgi:formate-dependent nitrite reductase membrane component NrfD